MPSKQPVVGSNPTGGVTKTKIDRFAHLWEVCPNRSISKLMLELLEEWRLTARVEPRTEQLAEYERCREIVAGLMFREKGGDPSPERAKIFFDSQKELVLQAMSEAKLGIWICMYLFTDHHLAAKVVEMAREGLTVELILQEDEKNLWRDEYWNELEKLGCPVR